MSATPLPPTPRDFDIHRMGLIMHLSTRRIAEKHGISQTRVRQIIERVSQWLAAMLRVKTSVEKEQQANLAQHLAAEQMRNQIEELQNFWDGSGDPKYLRQQTRIIAALARLGVVPGAIDALAAEAAAGPLDPDEPQPHWSEDDPWANSTQARSASEGNRASTSNSHSATNNSQSAAPPPGDCSAISSQPPNQAAAQIQSAAANGPTTTAFDLERRESEDTLEGLKTMERRLLNLIDDTASSEGDRLASLNNTLAEVRQLKASYELRLAPDIPGVEIRLDSPAPKQFEQEVTEVTESIRS